jgi:25S rRNA (cytosine2870-C5)-methyltransferase
MGHRSKNKQAAPEPLRAKAFSTQKKPGKRKADQEPDADIKSHPRPIKKLKGSQKASTQNGLKGYATNRLKNEHAISSGSSSDGWDDVEDLASHTK